MLSHRALRMPAIAAGALPLSFVLIAPTTPSAQTILLREGDLVPGTSWTVSSLGNTAASGPDRLVIGGNASTPEAATISFVLDAAGDCDTGTPADCVLRYEQTVGVYEQTSFESFFGVSDAGEVAYSPSATDTVTQISGLDGVWLDDAVIAIERQPYPHDPSMYWSFGSRPNATGDGQPVWVGGITDTEGGSTQNRGLFIGASATPLVIGGDMITGLPDPVSTGSEGISFDFRVSRLGTHWIAEIGTVTGSSTNDNSMVIDGAVVLVDGSPMTEGTLVPVAAGGIGGEAWDNFDNAGITESGTWMITGDTDGATATDEFIVIDGVIVHREGDTVDGEALTGAIEGAYMNADGDYAYVWDIVGGTGSLEALFFRDRLLVAEGDPVDWDGDGTIDIDTAIDNFTGIGAVTLTDRDGAGEVEVLCTVDVEVPLATGRGTQILEGFLAVSVQTGPVAVPGAAGRLPVALHATPSVLSGSGAVTFEATLVAGDASLAIFDVSGRRVATLFSGVAAEGTRRFHWDGRTRAGMAAEAGVYWARLSSGGHDVIARITRIP